MHALIILLGLYIFLPSAISPSPEILTRHEFHLSKCLIEYNVQESAIQVSLHLFIDDTEEALRRMGADQLFLCTEKEGEQAEHFLQTYLQKHFRLEIDGRQKKPEFLGKEITQDLAGMWCYLEITNVTGIRKLTITNELLMDVFEDQKNIVNVIGPGNQKGIFLFQKGESTDSVDFRS